MSRIFINSGSSFEREIAYSRAVVEGDFIFISGTTGFNYETMEISDDIVTQTRQCFENIKSALQVAGAELKDIVRIRYIVPDVDEFKATWPVLREYMSEVKAAATMFSAGLFDARMKIEIEVTAIKS